MFYQLRREEVPSRAIKTAQCLRRCNTYMRVGKGFEEPDSELDVSLIDRQEDQDKDDQDLRSAIVTSAAGGGAPGRAQAPRRQAPASPRPPPDHNPRAKEGPARLPEAVHHGAHPSYQVPLQDLQTQP
jgi:hypothetical protein